MLDSLPLTAANLARLGDIPYDRPFGKWGDLKSELDEDRSFDSNDIQSDSSYSSSSSDEEDGPVNSKKPVPQKRNEFDSDIEEEVAFFSDRDSLKSKVRRIIHPFFVPLTCKKCMLLAAKLIVGGIGLGIIYNKFNSNKSFSACAEEGFDSALKDAFSILTLMDRYSKTPISEYCQASLDQYKSNHFGG